MDMGNTHMSVGAADVRANRERRGLTQEELAKELGVTVEVVKAWESGERLVPKRRMATVRSVLGMDEFTESFGRQALLRHLGALAKQRREELGLGRQPFAREIGLGSDRTLLQFEFGRTLPTGQSLMKIEKGLGWRVGSVEAMMRQVNRKASEIRMEELDAEDALALEQPSHGLPEVAPLAFVSNEDLIAELNRRLASYTAPAPRPYGAHLKKDVKDLYGLAASTNSEHLEDDEPTDS